MDWGQFLILFLTISAMWLSSRADRRKTDQKIEEHRRETNEIIMSIREEIRNFNEKMIEESRDFHGRLCKIEEQKNRRK